MLHFNVAAFADVPGIAIKNYLDPMINREIPVEIWSHWLGMISYKSVTLPIMLTFDPIQIEITRFYNQLCGVNLITLYELL